MTHWLYEEIQNLLKADGHDIFYFAGHGIALESDDNPKGNLAPTSGNQERLIIMNELHDNIVSMPRCLANMIY